MPESWSFSRPPRQQLNVDFGIVRLAHRSLTPIAETFVRILQEVDEELSKFEQRNVPKIVGARARRAGFQSELGRPRIPAIG